MTLAQRVRDYRYSKGWGPDELANRAEISRTALYQIESGKTELPRAATLRRIAIALDVSMDLLLGHGGGEVAPRDGLVSPLAPKRTHAVMERSGQDHQWGHRASFGPATIEDAEGAFLAISSHHSSTAAGTETRHEGEVVTKLHVLLASPLGDGVVRIIEELYRSLPVSSSSFGSTTSL